MPAVFISYRHSDSQDVTGRIYDRLVAQFSQPLVFKDVDNIPLGVSFPNHLKQVLGKTGVVLVIIGPSWVQAADAQGRRRLEDPNDFVRVEVETALRAGIPVIPVLVSNASMPAASVLPRSIQGLVSRNGTAVRPDPDFNHDMGRLLSGIKKLQKLRRVQMAAEAQGPTAAPPPALPRPVGTPTPQPARRMTENAARHGPPRASLGLVGAGMVASLLVVLMLVWLWPGRRLPTGRDPTALTVVPTRRTEVIQPEKITPTTPKREDLVPGKDFLNTIGMQMKRIAAGPFQMGSDKATDSDALDTVTPRHPVTITRPFFLATCMTTQVQFEQILGRQPSWFSTNGSGKDKVNGIDSGPFPVENVAYFDAVEFCNKLSEKENRRPCYRLTGIKRNEDGSVKTAEVEPLPDGTGYRLPSEAEWEYCARAGVATRYWFGEDASQLGEHAWFSGNSDGRMHPVREKKANLWGFYDMGGLAYQWCDDVWHDNYQGAPGDGSAWRTGGEPARRVVRGGSWDLNARSCRCAYRNWSVAGNRLNYMGFRVVLVSP